MLHVWYLDYVHVDQATRKGEDAEVVVKYFTPDAQGTWLITEGNEMENGDWELFGYITLGYEWEWGYVWLSQLKEVRGKLGLPVERDLHCEGRKVKELK